MLDRSSVYNEKKFNDESNNAILFSKPISTCNHCFGVKKVETKSEPIPQIEPVELIHVKTDSKEESEMIAESDHMYLARARPSILIRSSDESKKKFNLSGTGSINVERTITPVQIVRSKNRKNTNRSCSLDSYEKMRLFNYTFVPFRTVQISNNAPTTKISSRVYPQNACSFRWSLANVYKNKNFEADDRVFQIKKSYSFKEISTYHRNLARSESESSVSNEKSDLPEQVNNVSVQYRNCEPVLLKKVSSEEFTIAFQYLVPQRLEEVVAVFVDNEHKKQQISKSDLNATVFGKIAVDLRNNMPISMKEKETVEVAKAYKQFIQDFKDMKNQNRFVYKSDLGEGAYGQVIECIDIRRKRLPVAIKMIKALLRNEGDVTREIDILHQIHQKDTSQFNHCATLLQYFSIDKILCLVFRRYGDNLYSFMKKRKFEPLPYQHVSQIAYQLFYAGSFLHDKCQIIHTDIKPENIVFTSSIYISKEERGSRTKIYPSKFDIKLIDFGNAVPVKQEKYNKLVGTRHYRSLEVILGCGWDEKVDCWSVGCVLYELYTGYVLFGATDDNMHLAMIDKVNGHIKHKMIKSSNKSHLFLLNGRIDESTLEFYHLIQCKPRIQFHFKQSCHQSKELTNIIINCLKNDPKDRPNFKDLLLSPVFQYLPEPFKRKYKLFGSLK